MLLLQAHHFHTQKHIHYLETTMDDTERATYERLRDEYMEAMKIRKAFVEHDWR